MVRKDLMPTQIEAQDAISLSQAAKLAPGRPSTCAVWRWCRVGVKSKTGQRVRLAHIRAGARIYTSKAALDAFFAAVAEADAAYFEDAPKPAPPSPPNSKRSPQQRQRDIEKAERDCKAAGI